MLFLDVLPVFSEHEECRVCLEPGLKRKCCGNYFCDDCYYALPACRTCDAYVGRKSLNPPINAAAVLSIIMGYMVTVFLCAIVVGSVVTIITSEHKVNYISLEYA